VYEEKVVEVPGEKHGGSRERGKKVAKSSDRSATRPTIKMTKTANEQILPGT